MADRYAYVRRRNALKIERWNTGTITLTRSTPGTPAAETPWIPGEPTLDVYAIDARLNGVAAEYVDGTEILATDRMAIVSPKAVHTLTDGNPADGATVDIVPQMSDTLSIDGHVAVVKKIEPVPAAGAAARFHIFIAS